VTMPLLLVTALWNILSVKRLTATSSASGAALASKLSSNPLLACLHTPLSAARHLDGAPAKSRSYSVSPHAILNSP
jgi:hypothetical protein